MKIARTFFSLYCFIAAIFLSASFLIDEAWTSYMEADVESYTGYAVMLEAIGDYLLQFPEEQWQQVIDEAAQKFEIPLELKQSKQIVEVHNNDINALQRGNVFIYFEGEHAYLNFIFKKHDALITWGPAYLADRPRIQMRVRLVLLLLLAMAILIWLLPISKDLDKLQQLVKSFGNGNFDIQVPKALSLTIAPINQAIALMTQRISGLIQAHKELTNAVSHELRTPLARTKFAVQMLERIDDKDKQQKYLAQIRNDVDELDDLINEMLLYAAFDSDRPPLHFEQYDIGRLITQVLDNFNQYHGHIEFVDNLADRKVFCDQRLIERALSNYVNNAIKYGNNHIVVSASCNDGHCLIAVDDNGDGVEDSFREHVFDAFTRADKSRSKETGGFGLGLAIVRRIMDWHQGFATVETSALGGARFLLQWPIKKITKTTK